MDHPHGTHSLIATDYHRMADGSPSWHTQPDRHRLPQAGRLITLMARTAWSPQITTKWQMDHPHGTHSLIATNYHKMADGSPSWHTQPAQSMRCQGKYAMRTPSHTVRGVLSKSLGELSNSRPHSQNRWHLRILCVCTVWQSERTKDIKERVCCDDGT
jgi:hypothetical protein